MFRHIARPLALVLAFLGAAIVHAQTGMAPVEPFVRVNVAAPDTRRLLNVEARNKSIVEVLGAIGGRGSLNMVVKAGVSGTIAALSLQNQSPEESLQKVCQIAGLSCEFSKGFWVVSPLPVVKAEPDVTPSIDNMVFSEVDARDLLQLLSTTYNVPLVLNAEVQGQIPFICLSHKTPREAIEVVALAINAQVTQDKDGNLIISAKPGA